MAISTDPRTAQQRVAAQLEAAHRQLTKPGLSRRDRARVADRIHQLKQEASDLGH
ncbi:hypothetical protein [Streptomyces chartreusis]|uniref:hypothetical protein n=1 Tax=Streptomyces chartreusis TaxID=1969 RepID=UPI0033CF0AF8